MLAQMCRFVRERINVLRDRPPRRRSAFARLSNRPLYDRYGRTAKPYDASSLVAAAAPASFVPVSATASSF